jgi:hypothetical protein
MNFFTIQRKKRGVTLIEMIIYTSILVAVSVFLVSSLLLLAEPFAILKISRDIHSSATISLERMSREIRSSDSVGVGSVLNTHPGVLMLLDGEIVTVFDLDNGSVRLTKDAVEVGSLTREGITVTNLVFDSLTNGTSDGIRIEVTIEGTNGKLTKSESFTTFVVMRGSY